MVMEVIREEKNITFDEFKFNIKLEQEDSYDAENVLHMVESWKKQLEEKQHFIDDFENIKKQLIEEAVKIGEQRLEQQLINAKQIVDQRKKDLNDWELKFKHWCVTYPRRYEQLLNEIKVRNDKLKTETATQ